MVSLTNISKGNLHLDSMETVLVQGQKLELPGSWSDNLMLYPELSLFLGRGRIAVEESDPESLDNRSGENANS